MLKLCVYEEEPILEDAVTDPGPEVDTTWWFQDDGAVSKSCTLHHCLTAISAANFEIMFFFRALIKKTNKNNMKAHLLIYWQMFREEQHPINFS